MSIYPLTPAGSSDSLICEIHVTRITVDRKRLLAYISTGRLQRQRSAWRRGVDNVFVGKTDEAFRFGEHYPTARERTDSCQYRILPCFTAHASTE
jgi:hypothetical protein